ncbi:MAG: RNA polymerase sigma factor [Actinomycetota bacterium]
MSPVLPAHHTDAPVVAALLAGDQQAFRALVAELNPGLTRMARTYVPEAIADEVVQETWMSVVKSIGSFEGRSSLKTWIYRIMLNKVRTLAARESKIVPFTSLGPRSGDDGPSVDPDRLVHPELGQGYWPDAPPRWDAQPDDRLEAAEIRKRIEAAIAALPPAQAEVVALRDVEGWSADEVCNALGISSVNQRVLLHRGRVAVRAMLEDYLT